VRKVLYILTRLTDEDVDWISSAGRRVRLPAGTVLIREGEPVDALTFVLEGSLSVTVDGFGELAKLGSGEILGEMSLVDESPPSATVTVIEPALVLSVDRVTLDAKTESDPLFAARLYRAIAMFLSVRLRRTVQRLGYGHHPIATHDEIDLELMETMHIAGGRFDRMLKKLTAM
jgi:CRP/FNR family transcriptional regulator, cyclic AMP receptor protein